MTTQRQSPEFKEFKAEKEAQNCIDKMLQEYPSLALAPAWDSVQARVHQACRQYNGL